MLLDPFVYLYGFVVEYLHSTSINDIINGVGFEFVGGLFLWTNVRRLYKDKKVSGVNIGPTAFYFLWGTWNLYYYESLHQYVSMLGGTVIAAGNFAWVLMALYYTYFKKPVVA
jgi:hypothetical protein